MGCSCGQRCPRLEGWWWEGEGATYLKHSGELKQRLRGVCCSALESVGKDCDDSRVQQACHFLMAVLARQLVGDGIVYEFMARITVWHCALSWATLNGSASTMRFDVILVLRNDHECIDRAYSLGRGMSGTRHLIAGTEGTTPLVEQTGGQEQPLAPLDRNWLSLSLKCLTIFHHHHHHQRCGIARPLPDAAFK